MNAPAYSHWLIAGVSQTGKSTFMRRLSRGMRRRQIVYDPTFADKGGAHGWRGDLAGILETINPAIESPRNTTMCHSIGDFLYAAENAVDADLFVDEAQDIFSQSQRENFALMTSGRHRGLQLHIASQRPKLIAPTVRTQVAVIICYRLERTDLRDVLAGAGLSIKRLTKEDTPRMAGEYLRADLASARLQFIREDIHGNKLEERELEWIC